MCFSFRVSVVTGAVCWVSALAKLACVDSDDVRVSQRAYFLLMYSSMQYADALLWANPTPNPINKWTTSYAIPTILAAQVVYNAHVNHASRAVYALAGVVVCYLFWRFHGHSITACGRTASPVWGGTELRAWEFLLFSFLVLYPQWTTLVATWVYMAVLVAITEGGYGSLWCSLACLEALFLWCV